MEQQYLKTISEHTELKVLPKGKILVREGEICRHIYFIEQGHLRTFYTKNGKDINVNFTFEKQFAANLKSFLYTLPSEYYIRAGETTVVRCIDREQLQAVLLDAGEQGSLSHHLMRLLIRQEEHANIFKIYTPSERYHYVATNYPKLLQRVSLSQLSSYLGISRETISRIRRNTPTFSNT